ncbi:MAG: polyprenyl synthetase family protein [Chloroflexi bacterium]|nr:polyprenyl synthetase family protein [Chloroflexota bacterium]
MTLTDELLKSFNQYYQSVIEAHIRPQPMFDQMLSYHLGWKDPAGNPANYSRGKQIRPLLALLSCGASGGDPQNALPLAIAIELLHNFSLIHDDIMDVSDLRRGRETVWKIWGVNQAINTGDGAYGLSFQLLAEAENADPASLVYAQRILSKACVDTVYGQMLDLSFEDREDVQPEEYNEMTGLKTGPLIGAALGGGALFAGADWNQAQTLAANGRELGVIFQMQDDILGIWGKPEETGKSVSDDLAARKKSYPMIWALEHLSQPEQERLRHLYHQTPPLPEVVTSEIRSILTAAGVREAVSQDAQERYAHLMATLEALYPKASPYRDALFNIVAFIVKRTH